MIEARHYINGKWVTGTTTIEVCSPTNPSEIIGMIPTASQSEVSEAAASASAASQQWHQLGHLARGNILHQAASRLEKCTDELAVMAASEMGKPIGESKGEALRAAAILRYYAGEGMRDIGQVIPASKPETLQYTLKEPLGTVGIITPWNFPLAIPMWKIAPALIYGNTVVFKPAEFSSLTAFKLLETIVDLFPAGVLNMTIGTGTVAGDALVRNENIDGISFTGSSQIGKHIATICADRGAKYQLEMGGKNPVVVAADADLSLALDLTVSGAMRSAGQKCTATSRVIVMDNIYDRFAEELVERVKALKVGNPLDSDTYIGPLVSESQQSKVLSLMEIGKTEGAVALLGGGLLKEPPSQGFFVAPSIFDKVPIKSTLAQEEIFGPVISLLSAPDISEAISMANSIRFGLSASIFTSSLASAMKFVDQIEAGLVRVNEETAGVELQAPFGGVKASSSHSREQGRAAIEFYTRTKTVAIWPGVF